MFTIPESNNIINDGFKPLAQIKPNKTIHINEGNIFYKNKFLYYPGGNTIEIQFPLEDNLYVLIGLNKLGIIKYHYKNYIPDIPSDIFPICYLFIKPNDTVISNDMIFDIRTCHKFGIPSIEHKDVLNKDEINSHDIQSITGLLSELSKKISKINHDVDILYLANTKTDNDGTPNSIWKLQKNNTGISNTISGLEIELGSDTNVFFKYFPIEKKWKYTEDGINIKKINDIDDIGLRNEIQSLSNRLSLLENKNEVFINDIENINTSITNNIDNINILTEQIQTLAINNDNIKNIDTIINDIQNNIEDIVNSIQNINTFLNI